MATVTEGTRGDDIIGLYMDSLQMEDCSSLSYDDAAALHEFAQLVPLSVEDESTPPTKAVLSRDRMISSCLKQAFSVAKRFSNTSSIPLSDLIGWANFHLVRAVDDWTPEKGCKLSTLVGHYVEKGLIQVLQDMKGHTPAYIPHTTRKQIKQLEGKEDYTVAELAESLGTYPTRIFELLSAKKLFGAISIHSDDDNDEEIVLADKEKEEPEYTPTEMARFFRKLDKRSRDIVRRRHGFNGYQEHDLKEIGEVYKISKERIRQILIDAHAVIRECIELSKTKPPRKKRAIPYCQKCKKCSEPFPITKASEAGRLYCETCAPRRGPVKYPYIKKCKCCPQFILIESRKKSGREYCKDCNPKNKVRHFPYECKCKKCGKPFVVEDKSQNGKLYCSAKCRPSRIRSEMQKIPYDRTCACGTVFTIRDSHHNGQLTCEKCHKPRSKTYPYIKQCKKCGKDFTITKGSENGRKYCSDCPRIKEGFKPFYRKCRGCKCDILIDGMAKFGKWHCGPDCPGLNRICKGCNKPFKMKRPAHKSHQGLYCSHYCGCRHRKKNLIKICSGCEKEFRPKMPCIQCCSPECVKIARRKGYKPPEKVTKKCKICRKPFISLKRKEQVTCGRKCGHAYVGRLNTVTYKKVCETCKVKFKTGNKDKKYCSKECRSKAASELQKKKKPKRVTACEQCHKEFFPANSAIRFCSRKCMADARKLPEKICRCGKTYRPKTSRPSTCGSPECAQAQRVEKSVKTKKAKKARKLRAEAKLKSELLLAPIVPKVAFRKATKGRSVPARAKRRKVRVMATV